MPRRRSNTNKTSKKRSLVKRRTAKQSGKRCRPNGASSQSSLSEKTIEWLGTALGLMRHFLEEELDITQIDDVDADDISAWFAHLRSTPAARGKVRSERTIQTYARSARAFFHWLVRR